MRSTITLVSIVAFTIFGQGRALALYADQAAHFGWGDATNGAVVPVCYTSELSTKQGFTSFLATIRLAVESTWGRAANIRFKGWGQCAATPPNATVVLRANGSGSTFTGYHSDSPTNMTMDPEWIVPEVWGHTAVHEFGHALGFQHEQKRWDNPYHLYGPQYECGIAATPIAGQLPGRIFITYYDPESIMNYCGENTENGVYNPYRTALSAADILGAIEVYGKKQSQSIIAFNGKAVNLSGDAWSVNLAPASTSGLQKLVRSGDLFTALNYSGRNLSVSWNGVIVVATSDATPLYQRNQRWVTQGNYCVTALGEYTHAPLQLRVCDNTTSYQRWDLDAYGRIVLSGTNMCLNVPWGAVSPSAPTYMQIYPCQSPAVYNEQFTFGSYAIQWGGQCIRSMSNGMALYTCPLAPDPYDLDWAIYHFNGEIAGPAGGCMAYSDKSTRLSIASCNGSNFQSWDVWP